MVSPHEGKQGRHPKDCLCTPGCTQCPVGLLALDKELVTSFPYVQIPFPASYCSSRPTFDGSQPLYRGYRREVKQERKMNK
jgi:hypothetical protein